MRDASRALIGALLLVAVSWPAGASKNWPEERVMDQSFDVGAGGSLQVEVQDADVDLRVGSGSGVEIEIYLASEDLEAARPLYERMNFRAEADGNKVALRSDSVNYGWRWSRHDRVGFRVRAVIVLPERFDVDLTTGDGDVRVESIVGQVRLASSDGDLLAGRIEGPEAIVVSSDGDVTVTELRCDRAEVRTSDGDIVVGSFDGGRLEVRTSDGDISVERTSGQLQARTSDGDIDVGFDRFDETTLSTSDGDVSVTANGTLAANVDLSGEQISLPSAGFDGQRGRRAAQGTLNGGGPTLRVSSRDGTVSLKVL